MMGSADASTWATASALAAVEVEWAEWVSLPSAQPSTGLSPSLALPDTDRHVDTSPHFWMHARTVAAAATYGSLKYEGHATWQGHVREQVDRRLTSRHKTNSDRPN